jgi:hypothetical protein
MPHLRGRAEEAHHPADDRDEPDEREDEDDEEHPSGDVGQMQDGLFHGGPLRYVSGFCGQLISTLFITPPSWHAPSVSMGYEEQNVQSNYS